MNESQSSNVLCRRTEDVFIDLHSDRRVCSSHNNELNQPQNLVAVVFFNQRAQATFSFSSFSEGGTHERKRDGQWHWHN